MLSPQHSASFQITVAAFGTLERYRLTDVAREDYLSSYEAPYVRNT